MTRRHLATLRLLLILTDGVASAFVFRVISIIRFDADPSAVWSVGIDVGAAAIIFALGWVAIAWAAGLYRLRARWSLLAEARDVLRATVALLVITLSLLFILHQDNVSRVFLLLLFAAQPFVALAIRAGLRAWFEELRKRGNNLTYMVIAGTGALAQSFADRIEAHPGLGVRVVGHLAVPSERRRTTDGVAGPMAATLDASQVSRPILGTVDEMGALFHEHPIDEVAICLPAASAHHLEPILAVAANEGKTVRVPRDLDEAILQDSLQEEFDGFLVRSVIHDGQRDMELAIKRVVDIGLASVALLVLSPLIVGAALTVWLRDGRPILFRQTRVGRHGRRFTMLKFRTMVNDAEQQQAALADQNYVKGPAFKLLNDPRVTPLGRFLRRTSIDELPQLFNVVAGEMSLVGPRPALPREVDSYDIWHRRRLSMRPGITGLWQVECRMNDQFDKRAELDLRYIDQWSIWRDMRILLRTVPAVLTKSGQ